MARAYPERMHLVQIDDDIEGMKTVVSSTGPCQGTEASKGTLDKIIRLAAKLMSQEACCLWGLNPSDNEFYMPCSVSRKHGLVLGSCFGLLNRWEDTLLPSLSSSGQHEDVERTIRHLERDGRVLRMSFAAVVSKYRTNLGGMQATFGKPAWREMEAQRVAKEMARRWPQFGYVKPTDSCQFVWRHKGLMPLPIAKL